MKDEYIKLEEAVEKFIAVNARSFDTDQIVYLLNKLPKYEMPNCKKCEYKREIDWATDMLEICMDGEDE